MTLNEAVKNCIAHWERMIKWARGKEGEAFENHYKARDEMFESIGETYTCRFCALCFMFFDDSCESCPLVSCGARGDFFHEVMLSRTWGAWVLAAEKLLARLREIEKEVAGGR